MSIEKSTPVNGSLTIADPHPSGSAFLSFSIAYVNSAVNIKD